MMTRRPAVALATLLALPLALTAQARPRRPEPAATPTPRLQGMISPTELLDRRRELDLTPRQVARLDSLERRMIAQRRTLADQARALRDSTCGRDGRCNLSDSARRNFRDRLVQLRGRQVDTTLGRQAMAILDSTQRGRVQGMRMGRIGQRMAMQRGGMRRGGFAGPQRPGRDRMDVGPRGRRGPAAGRWMDAPRRGRMMEWDGRRPDRPVPPLPPMRRRGDEPGAPPADSPG